MRSVGTILFILTLALLSAAAVPVLADAPVGRLTPEKLDALLAAELPDLPAAELADDELFLRRLAIDLTGRQPTVEETDAFLADAAPGKRRRAAERLLAAKEYAGHWADYWSDTISYRVPPPELTFLDYTKFKAWLADHFDRNTPWDEITRGLLTATGEIKKDPAVTFIGYHEGNPVSLATETARIFLGVQLECAQCHDHKFEPWKREQFHGLAAFFARSQAKLGSAQDGSSTAIKDSGKGEYKMPHESDPRKPGTVMEPAFLTGDRLKLDLPDLDRRAALADFVTRPDSPWFARAYVNRVWAELTGRGFYEPVDNMGESQFPVLTKVHDALAAHFVATGFDTKDLARLVTATRAYQLRTPLGARFVNDPTPATRDKLSGDEVFQSLARGIGLPNVTPPRMKATAEVRFPPPPKSTRDLVADRFGHDPSVCPEEVSRTMAQAMLLMNNDQIQKQIDAGPGSGTLLSRLLRAEQDDAKLFTRIFRQVMARRPTGREIDIALSHVGSAADRGEAFEDIVWALVNSAEFTTRR